MIQKHFLVVGAGVAGISICKQFISRGHKIKLIDSGINRSSAVAAGLINPIVFRRMTKSWRIDEFLPEAKKFYTDLERDCGETFLFPIQIRRLFSSEQERNFWIEKQDKLTFQEYLNPITEEDLSYDKAVNEFGTGRLKQGYYISTTSFMEKTKHWISKSGIVRCEKVDYSKIDPETASYKGIKYDGIVFCEGAEIHGNPWFKDLPVNDTKGETLTIQSKGIPENESLNRKCFILPMGNNEFRVGATYVWDTSDSNLTEEGKKELQGMISYATSSNYKIIDHQAGVRPTTLDRRPLMGSHFKHGKLFVFNGLGTKGYLLAPLLAKEMIEFMLDGRILDKEVGLARTIK
jgi:glycine/D-amino acid oxidase-like deaminating enzyme